MTPSTPMATARTALDPAPIRAQFPILSTLVQGHPLVYLDNAASSQKPDRVIETLADYYRHRHANIHRGVYRLSIAATQLHEDARATVAAFINAADPAECIFTRGTTESINLVAATWGLANLRPGDEIILSELEHHSNIVPWQMAAERTGARILVIPIDDRGALRLDVYQGLLSPRTRLVAVNQVSNALGTINPVAGIIRAAHAVGALALIDGAQWVAHGTTDVQALDADFYAFSGHKLYGPTGIGVLYGKRRLLDAMPPYQGGGDMIERVTFAHTTYAGLPGKFEAGTPDIAGALGLAAAIEWVSGVGLESIAAHEAGLLARATERFAAIPGVEIKGTAPHKAGVLSFVVTDPPVGTLDVGTALDLQGICIRTGHHCCQPLMDRLGVASTARASFGVYNTLDEINALADVLTAFLEDRRAARAAAGPVAAPAGAACVYPQAQAESPAAAAAELAELFELLPDWTLRYQQLMDLGARLPVMPAALKTPTTLVHGCQSLVHLDARVRPGTEDVLEFLADSDAAIVRGLIALLQRLFSGQRAADILAFDAEAFFNELGLDRHLTLGRRTGLASMQKRLRDLAAAVAARSGALAL